MYTEALEIWISSWAAFAGQQAPPPPPPVVEVTVPAVSLANDTQPVVELPAYEPDTYVPAPGSPPAIVTEPEPGTLWVNPVDVVTDSNPADSTDLADVLADEPDVIIGGSGEHAESSTSDDSGVAGIEQSLERVEAGLPPIAVAGWRCASTADGGPVFDETGNPLPSC